MLICGFLFVAARMLFHSYIVRAVVFLMAALIGSLGYYVIGYHVLSDAIDKSEIESDQAFFRRLGFERSPERIYSRGSGIGSSTHGTSSFRKNSSNSHDPSVKESYKILSKPKPSYTEAARSNGIEGTVRLKVTLLASGQIGPVTPVTRLPFGLTEEAIKAARNLRFEPRTIDGVPQSVVVTVDYRFDIY